MITAAIPDREELKIKHVVFDFNGTLATDGAINKETREMISLLKEHVHVHVVTSDTYGTAREACGHLGVDIVTLTTGKAAAKKASFVESCGAENTCCIGNGVNDSQMFEVCALAIMVIGAEGGSVKALQAADIVVTRIENAIELLLKPQRIVAALRE